MHNTDFLSRLSKIRVWRKGTKRAPHKPLLILYALGQVRQGNKRFIPYCEIEPKLTSLLRKFGPPANQWNPHYPFGRLVNDGLWELLGDEEVRRTKSKDLVKTSLKQHDVRGGFIKTDYQLLSSNVGLIEEGTSLLLEAHFPRSTHDDIRSAVGLEFSKTTMGG